MRQVSDSVLRRLREYDPEVDVRWDERRARWFLHWRDRRICTLEHRDGSPMLADVVVEETMDILRRSDNYKDGPERLREFDRNLARHRERVAAYQARVKAEGAEQSGEVLDVAFRGGAKPFVHIQNNPMHRKAMNHAS